MTEIKKSVNSENMDFEDENGDHELKSLFSALKQNFKCYRFYKPFSFLSGHERTVEDVKATVTAAGLLQDVAVQTADPDDVQKKKKSEAKEIFCAYCLNLCAHMVENLRGKPEDQPLPALDMLFEFPVHRIGSGSRDPEKTAAAENDWTEQPALIRELTCRLNDNVIIKDFRAEVRRRVCSRQQDLWEKDLAEHKIMDPEEGEYFVQSKLIELILAHARQAMKAEAVVIAVSRALAQCYARKMITLEQYDIICYNFGLGDGFGDGVELTKIAEKMGKNCQYIRRQSDEAYKILGRYLIDNKLLLEVL